MFTATVVSTLVILHRFSVFTRGPQTAGRLGIFALCDKCQTYLILCVVHLLDLFSCMRISHLHSQWRFMQTRDETSGTL